VQLCSEQHKFCVQTRIVCVIVPACIFYLVCIVCSFCLLFFLLFVLSPVDEIKIYIFPDDHVSSTCMDYMISVATARSKQRNLIHNDCLFLTAFISRSMTALVD